MMTTTAVERMVVKWGNTTKVVTIGKFQELIFELERMGHTIEKLGDSCRDEWITQAFVDRRSDFQDPAEYVG